MTYRKDIDGLRAIAVLSVILCHANPEILPGGFVGVDVFFVISGFLISLQIFQQLATSQFSVGEFYRKRIKRIAPAMLVVLAVTLLLSQILFRPEDAERTARSAFWSVLSLANVYFWRAEDGAYFGPASDEMPLLHFWSLGVEEQFYFIWPVILLLSASVVRTRTFGVLVALIAAVSFMFAERYFETDASFVYYMLPARAGELLLGALVAWYLSGRNPRRVLERINGPLAALGMIAVVASMFVLSEDTVFPGLAALPVSIGTALLIYTGWVGPTVVSAMLGWRPMVLVGLVSYSAYLWHWPLLALLNYAGVRLSILQLFLYLFVTFLLSWLSYRFVETPFRRSRDGVMRVLLKQYLLPGAVCGAIAVLSLKTDGWVFHQFSESYVADLRHERQAVQAPFQKAYICQSQRADDATLSDPTCIVGLHQEDEPNVILWGDSNASHYVGMLGEFAAAAGFSFRNIEVGACAPLQSDPSAFVGSKRRADCRHSNDLVWPALDSYDVVIIAANWSYYGEAYIAQFADTVNALVERDARVILLGKAPILNGYDRLCAQKSLRLTFMDCSVPPTPMSEAVESVNSALRAIASQTDSVDYFDANDVLCSNGYCPLTNADGQVLYYNNTHLSFEGSAWLGRQIVATRGVPSLFSSLAGAATDPSR